MRLMDPIVNGRIWGTLITAAWLVIAAVAMFPAEIGALEGRLNPVIRDFRITSIAETADGATVIYAEGTKARSCALRDVDWSLVNEGLDSAVGFDNREIQRVNRPGTIKMGPWVVYASKQEVLERGRAVIVHRCHWTFLTRTPIFKAPGAE